MLFIQLFLKHYLVLYPDQIIINILIVWKPRGCPDSLVGSMKPRQTESVTSQSQTWLVFHYCGIFTFCLELYLITSLYTVLKTNVIFKKVSFSLLLKKNKDLDLTSPLATFHISLQTETSESLIKNWNVLLGNENVCQTPFGAFSHLQNRGTSFSSSLFFTPLIQRSPALLSFYFGKRNASHDAWVLQ